MRARSSTTATKQSKKQSAAGSEPTYTYAFLEQPRRTGTFKTSAGSPTSANRRNSAVTPAACWAALTSASLFRYPSPALVVSGKRVAPNAGWAAHLLSLFLSFSLFSSTIPFSQTFNVTSSLNFNPATSVYPTAEFITTLRLGQMQGQSTADLTDASGGCLRRSPGQ